MRKLLIIPALVIWLGMGQTALKAQTNGVYASVGMASVRMDDMKYLLESIMGTYPVEAKIISSFPPYLSTSFGVIRNVYPHLSIGAGYGFTTTGAKSDYTDYSGTLQTNIVAVSHRIGALASYKLLKGEHLEFSINGRLDVNLARMEVSSSINAAGYSSGVSNKYRSISPQVSAAAELMYHFGKYSLGMEGGYLVDMPGKLKNSSGGQELKDPEDPRRVLTSDWTGWRAGIKFILWLDFNNTTSQGSGS